MLAAQNIHEGKMFMSSVDKNHWVVRQGWRIGRCKKGRDPIMIIPPDRTWHGGQQHFGDGAGESDGVDWTVGWFLSGF